MLRKTHLRAWLIVWHSALLQRMFGVLLLVAGVAGLGLLAHTSTYARPNAEVGIYLPIAINPPAPTATATPLPTMTPTPEATIAPTPAGTGCDPSYPTVCIPPPPPDLSCKQIPYKRFKVLPPDPHGFDRDHDGIGCE